MRIPAPLRSRKFWLTVTAVIGAIGAWFSGEMSAAQAIFAIVTAVTGYNAAEGYADGKRAEAVATK